jgi:hypothetical protein
MLDLKISLALMLGLCLAAACAGAALQRRGDRRAVTLALLLVSGVMTVYLTLIWDRPLLSRLLPFSGAIILGNWLPVMGAFLAGICWRTPCISRARRWTLAPSLCLLGGYSLVSPLLGESPRVMPTMNEASLAYQTTESTCSAACAAALLRLHGIAATEQELADLCLTRRGTHWLGVYRGLKLKTAGTEWTVVVDEINPSSLNHSALPLGVLSLTFHPLSAERARESGFGTDVGHSVLSLGRSQRHRVIVFDPAPDYGIEYWDAQTCGDIRNGILLRLVSTRGTPSPRAEWNDEFPRSHEAAQVAHR